MLIIYQYDFLNFPYNHTSIRRKINRLIAYLKSDIYSYHHETNTILNKLPSLKVVSTIISLKRFKIPLNFYRI